jgi:hypothetical protein
MHKMLRVKLLVAMINHIWGWMVANRVRLPKPLSIVLGIRGMKCDAKDTSGYCFMVQASMCRLGLRLSSSAAWFGGIRMISSKTDDLQPAVVLCSSWSWANLRRTTNSGPIFQMVLSFHWHVTVCQI